MHVYEYLVHTYVQIDPEQRMKKGMRERGVGGDGVCGCSLGEPRKQQETWENIEISMI